MNHPKPDDLFNPEFWEEPTLPDDGFHTSVSNRVATYQRMRFATGMLFWLAIAWTLLFLLPHLRSIFPPSGIGFNRTHLAAALLSLVTFAYLWVDVQSSNSFPNNALPKKAEAWK